MFPLFMERPQKNYSLILKLFTFQELQQVNLIHNGIINFGTGGTTYEILSATATSIHLRNIGADGNSWYQKLKAK